ncbi:UDP-N-acetylglucosamine 6-dehydrogenase [Cladobotryum mycophilum]|uniref:UDP-N-acetylglucosamine 6-dehydrogenase n=1 Tax=Cladobotryum mycophilum TaxID=491253 RepID=A0ABR0T0G6_9HYPO
MESSVAVGMTRELLGLLVATKKVKVGMSLERLDPGRQFLAFQKIPKIISGIEPSSLDAAQRLYERVFDHLVPVSSLEVAEMAKLYENC